MNKAYFKTITTFTGYCPHCRTVVNLAGTAKILIASGPNEKTETITVRTYHCELCHSFVRSEKNMGNLSDSKAKKPKKKIGFDVRERMARYRASGHKRVR